MPSYFTHPYQWYAEMSKAVYGQLRQDHFDPGKLNFYTLAQKFGI